MSERNGTTGTVVRKSREYLDHVGKILGANLKMYREDARLTHEQLAEKAGLPVAMLERCEQDGDTMGTVALCWLAHALECTLDDLLDGAFWASLKPIRPLLCPTEQDRADPVSAIIRNIKALRAEARMSLLELSRQANLSRSCIDKIEKHQHEPTIATLLQLCEALKVSPQTLVFRRERVNRIHPDQRSLLCLAIADTTDICYLDNWLFATMSLEEIAVRCNKSRQLIHQRIKKAVAELKDFPQVATRLVEAIMDRIEQRLSFDVRPVVHRDRRRVKRKTKVKATSKASKVAS